MSLVSTPVSRRFSTLEQLEGRKMFSVAAFGQEILTPSTGPALTVSLKHAKGPVQTVAKAPKLVGADDNLVLAKTKVDGVFSTGSTSKLARAVGQRQTLSVITVSNPTDSPVNYQVMWEGSGKWTTHRVEPGKSLLHKMNGQNKRMFIRFDASFANGTQFKQFKASSKPFVAGGLEGWQPRYVADGINYRFGRTSDNNGLTLMRSNKIDTMKYAQQRVSVNQAMPQLGGKFEILGPQTPVQSLPNTYNCIAWSIGITDQWVWPGETVADFDRLYAQFGFKRMAQGNMSLQAGYEKIVLYAKDGVCTHAARQLPDGTWSSKLGSLPLIRHAQANVFGGTIYGTPVAVYCKAVASSSPMA